MFSGFSKNTVDFLWNIRLNNEKTWFEAHKDEYKKFLELPMKQLAREVYEAFSNNHPEFGLNVHLSRIYRDARRLHGNGPYKDHLWFTLRQTVEEWAEKPVFWFEIEPESWTYGLGYYRARPETMEKHRARIDKRPDVIGKLMQGLNAQKEFLLEGENFSRPKGDPGELLFDWYNKKTFSLIHEESIGETLFSKELVLRLLEGFEFLVPYFQYFSTLDADPKP